MMKASLIMNNNYSKIQRNHCTLSYQFLQSSYWWFFSQLLKTDNEKSYERTYRQDRSTKHREKIQLKVANYSPKNVNILAHHEYPPRSKSIRC